jgi:NCS1 family nucleobase:cation symporter-1
MTGTGADPTGRLRMSPAPADESVWPLLPVERTWGPWRLAITLATAAAATWCYLIGETVGAYLGFVQGALALTGGCMIGMVMVLVAAGPISVRFGIDSIAATKPQFGTRGWVIPALLQSVSIIGWNSLLLIFFAKSALQLLIVLGIVSQGAIPAAGVPVLTLLACAIIFLALRNGAQGVSMVSNILVAHVLVGCWMLYLLVSRRWPELMAARPAAAAADAQWNYITGVELGIATTLSWWPYLGAMIRMAPNGRTTVLPVLLGMSLPVPVLSLIGLAGVLVLGSSNPAEWLRTVGGPVYAVISLAFVTAANFGTAVAGIYASAIGLKNFAWLERRSWTVLLGLTVLPIAVIGMTIPQLFFTKFGSFLGLIGVAFAPLCGIQIADYFAVRQRQINLRDIYLDGPQSGYYYSRGFNVPALLALAAGCITYVALLNPLTYASSPPYRYLTASLPASVAAGTAHILLSWLRDRRRRFRASAGELDV